MRVVNYIEDEEKMEFTMTVRMDHHEWRKFDVRTFDVISFHDKAKESVNPKLIQNIIYQHFGLTDGLIARMSDAKEMGRIRRLVDIRRYCYFFIRTYTSLSYEDIGALYGQDHATVMHHVKKVNNWLDFDSSVMSEAEEIRKKLIERVNPYHEKV